MERATRDQTRSRDGGDPKRALARRVQARALHAILGSAVHRMNNLLAVSTTQLQLIELDIGKQSRGSAKRRLASTRDSLERSGSILALLASIVTPEAQVREVLELAPLLADLREVLPAGDQRSPRPLLLACDAGLCVRAGRGILVTALVLVLETLANVGQGTVEGRVVVSARTGRGDAEVDLRVAFEPREGQLPFPLRPRPLDRELIAWLGANAITVAQEEPGPGYILRLRAATGAGA